MISAKKITKLGNLSWIAYWLFWGNICILHYEFHDHIKSSYLPVSYNIVSYFSGNWLVIPYMHEYIQVAYYSLTCFHVLMFEKCALQTSKQIDQDSRNIQPGMKLFEIQHGVGQNARETKVSYKDSQASIR